MNRLRDIRQTLVPNLEAAQAYGQAEWILVDYSSSDGLADWVRDNCGGFIRSGLLRFFRVSQKQHWHAAHAKNIAHKQAVGEIVCNIDADSFASIEYIKFVAQSFSENVNVLGSAWKWREGAPDSYARLSKGNGGRIFLARKHFEELGGYDFRYFGYALEDRDLMERAVRKGLDLIFTPAPFLKTIVTSDEDRMMNLPRIASEPDISKELATYVNRNKIVFSENERTRVIRVNLNGWGEDVVEQLFADASICYR